MNAAQASCTVTVDVTSNIAGTYNNTNAGNITATQRVDTTGVSSTLTVQALPTLTKAFSPTTVGVGQNSVLTFTITNPAGAPARTGLTFTDTLPAGLVISTPNGVAGTCSGTPTITATAGAGVFTVGGTGVDAAVGASTCTISLNVTSNTAGAYVNGAAQVTAIAGMLNGVTNQTLTVTQASLTKAFAPATISQGGTSTLTFTITNGAGNPAQAGINFTDTLPANVVIAGTPNVTTSCPSGTGVVTATAGTGVITVTGATMKRRPGLVHGDGGRDQQHGGDLQQHQRRQHLGHAAGGHLGGELDPHGAGAADAHEGVQPDDGGGGAELGPDLHDQQSGGRTCPHRSYLHGRAAGRCGDRYAQWPRERLRRHAHDHGDGGDGDDHRRRHGRERRHRRLRLHDHGERDEQYGRCVRERRRPGDRHRRDVERCHEPDAHRHAGLPHEGVLAGDDPARAGPPRSPSRSRTGRATRRSRGSPLPTRCRPTW
ncbi:MAG: hypothetical protein IPP91_01070 [Betaproteobacteria bacterium]|nr:hypothetical protein [Betaproteobacteria bacterium]